MINSRLGGSKQNPTFTITKQETNNKKSRFGKAKGNPTLTITNKQ